MSQAVLLSAEGLTVSFPGRARPFAKPDVVRAVDGVDLTIKRGQTLGLVGESGCGKSTTGYALLRLNKGSGRVMFDGIDLMQLPPEKLRSMRRRIQIIFQDAAASLDPRMTIGDLIAEALDLHGLHTGESRQPRVRELLELVGIPQRFAERYPHELSGGQAQRIAICRALAVEPDLIICDEAVSALDVSIQAQILNLLADLKEQFGLTLIFISHNLSVVRHVSDRILVLYLGRMVELTDGDELYNHPKHPYTRALLTAVPVPDPQRARQRTIEGLVGEIPSPINPPSGCAFRTRCRYAIGLCAEQRPPLENTGTGLVACHRWKELELAAGA